MSDIFEETEETLRQEQWLKIAKVAGPWVAAALGAALLIALSIWGWDKYQTNLAANTSDTYQAGIEAGAKGDTATAKTKLEAVVKTGTPAYKAMAMMELAGIAVHDGNMDEAIKQFDAAAKAAHDPRLADLAALKAAYLVMNKGPYADVQKRLAPLTEKDRPYAPLAKEALAMAKLQNGDVKGARADLNMLSVSLDAPEGIKRRAGLFVQAIDAGGAETAKAAVALPEPKMPTLPAGLPDGMQVQQ